MTSCPPSTRSSGRLEKQTPPMTPVKMKSEKDGKHDTQIPLRRSERGNKDVSSSSLESVQVSSSFEAKRRKIQCEKSLKELNVEADKVGICRKNNQESSGIKRKRMNARSFKDLFRSQKNKNNALDDSRRMDASSDAECADIQLSNSKLTKPREKEGNNCVTELANDTEEERFEDGVEKLVSSSQISVASISRDVGEVELSNSRARGSITEGSTDPPPVTSNVDGDTLIGNTCFGAEVSPEMDIMDSFSIEASKKQEIENAGDSVNPSLGEEPVAGHRVIHANQSLLVPAVDCGASSSSPASGLNSHDNLALAERNKDPSNEKKSIHIYLTEEVEKLCEILAVKEDMKHMLHAFLKYVVENHCVSKEDIAVFQALQISLCWIAASILKQRIDMRASLILAKQKLNFVCSDEEAEYVYKKLQMLEEPFQQQPIIIKELQALINPTSTEGDVLKNVPHAKSLESVHIRSESQETAHEENLTYLEHTQDDGGCNYQSETKSMSMLYEKQQEEIDEFHKIWEDERLQLVNKKPIETAAIRNIYSQNTVRMEKLKLLDTKFSWELEDHKKLKAANLKVLRAKHLGAINEERKKAAQSLAKYRGSENRTSNDLPLRNVSDTGLATINVSQGNASLSDLHTEEHTHNDIANKSLTNNLILHAKSVGCEATHHTRNEVVNDLQSRYSAVSDSRVEVVGCTSRIDSDDLQDEFLNDLRTSEGFQSDAPVRAMIDAIACDIPSGTTHTLNETVHNLHSNDDTLIDACVDAAKEAEGGSVIEKIGSVHGAPASEGPEVTVQERAYVLGDEEPNETCPGYSSENNHFVKHSMSERETHEKQKLASNVVDHHYVCKGIGSAKTATSNGQSLDKPFPGEANEPIPADVPEDAQEEVRITDNPDTNITVLQSNGTDDKVVSYDTHDSLGTKRDHANGIDPSSEKLSLVAHPHEVIDSVDHAISAPLIQANTGDLSQCEMSAEVQGEDQPNQDNLSKSTDSVELQNVAPLDTTHDLTAEGGDGSSGTDDSGLALEPNYPTCFEQQTSPREHVPLGAESGGSACQIFNDGCTPLQATLTTHQVEEPTKHLQHQPQVGENVRQSSSSDTGNDNIGNNRHSLPHVLNQGGEPTSGLGGSPHRVGPPSEVDDGASERINPAVLQISNQSGLSNSNISVHADPLQATIDELPQCEVPTEVQGEDQPNQANLSQSTESMELENVDQLVTNNLTCVVAGDGSSVAAQSGPSSSHLRLHADPLQIELEKLRKEVEQASKGHENLKSQLQSDCEKEIAEVVAEIRKKYGAKVQDAEAIFQVKKKALDTNVNKVLLNKILANAANTKSIDFWPSGVWRQQGFVQQLQQIPLQPTSGPTNVGTLSAGGTPAVQQSTSLTSPAEPRSSALLVGASCRPPIISSIAYPQTNARVGGEIRVAPHLQSVGADVRAAAPHLQPIRADIRSAAPHLQPFRRQVSVPAPIRSSLPHNVTTQQLSVNQPSHTLPSHVLPVQPRESSPLQMSKPSPRFPHMPTQVFLPFSQPQISPSISQRVPPALYHSRPPSAQELRRDIDRRFSTVHPNHSVSPVFLDSNVGSGGQSALRQVQGGSASSNPMRFIDLSDDE